MAAYVWSGPNLCASCQIRFRTDRDVDIIDNVCLGLLTKNLIVGTEIVLKEKKTIVKRGDAKTILKRLAKYNYFTDFQLAAGEDVCEITIDEWI